MSRDSTGNERLRVQGVGLLLFLFIPVVLYLYVQHPEPIGLSLGLGFVLMVGHRFLARPFMTAVAERKCLWSNRLVGADDEVDEVEIGHRGGVQPARCLRRYRSHFDRFFAFVYRFRLPLALGIFVPLLTLLVCLAFVAFGATPPLDVDTATAFFQGVVALTVQSVAWGYLFVSTAAVSTTGTGEPGKDGEPPSRVTFPVHNFFLLGISNLLWIFRIVGLWWTYKALVFFFGPF